MFLVTNRAIDRRASGLDRLRSIPSDCGPNELRVVEARRRDGRWAVRLLPDRADRHMTRVIRRAIKLPTGAPLRASQYAAAQTMAAARRSGRNVLLFVHGYNNNVRSVLDRMRRLEQLYGVIAIGFSWPANGGGNVIEEFNGLVSYRSDKRDARASAGAFDRMLVKMHTMLQSIDLDRRGNCPLRVSLLLHSMGNYLYKCVLSSSAYASRELMLFDNVVLCAADVNNAGHAEWVDRICVRNRVYVTINEDDYALRVSRLKFGDTQRARLGQWPHQLDSAQATYVHVTDRPGVGDSHTYFEGPAIENADVYRFFHDAMNGRRARMMNVDHAQDSA